MDIYAKNNLCPICNSKLESKELKVAYTKSCNNECYSYIYYKLIDEYSFDIFGLKLSVFNRGLNDITKKLEDIIKKEINYWKENERYLIKILENSN